MFNVEFAQKWPIINAFRWSLNILHFSFFQYVFFSFLRKWKHYCCTMLRVFLLREACNTGSNTAANKQPQHDTNPFRKWRSRIRIESAISWSSSISTFSGTRQQRVDASSFPCLTFLHIPFRRSLTMNDTTLSNFLSPSAYIVSVFFLPLSCTSFFFFSPTFPVALFATHSSTSYSTRGGGRKREKRCIWDIAVTFNLSLTWYGSNSDLEVHRTRTCWTEIGRQTHQSPRSLSQRFWSWCFFLSSSSSPPGPTTTTVASSSSTPVQQKEEEQRRCLLSVFPRHLSLSEHSECNFCRCNVSDDEDEEGRR